jgi:hypothetical protein
MQIQDFEILQQDPPTFMSVQIGIDFLRIAHAVTDSEGNVLALVQNEKIAKTVQWAIAAQAESTAKVADAKAFLTDLDG